MKSLPLRKLGNCHQNKGTDTKYGIKAIYYQINFHQIVLHFCFCIRNNGKNPAENHKCGIAGNPDKIYLKADRDTLSANGKDLSFITVEIQDKEGNLCPRDASLLFVKVNGNGKLKALCNGDATDLIPFTSNYMRVFNGKMVIIVESKNKTGEINIEVSGERLKTGFYKLTCQQ